MRLETDLGISIDIGIDIELRARTPLLRHPLELRIYFNAACARPTMPISHNFGIV